jgi:hypothetical protein
MTGSFRYMNAEKYNLDRIYFGGCFIRGTRHNTYPNQKVELSMLQGMRLQSRRCLTLSASGVRERNEHCFFDMKDFCEYGAYILRAYLHTNDRGSIGAWIRNIDPDEE